MSKLSRRNLGPWLIALNSDDRPCRVLDVDARDRFEIISADKTGFDKVYYYRVEDAYVYSGGITRCINPF
jgi:hypothetical protein